MIRSKPLLRITLGEVLRRERLEQCRTLADVSRSALVSMPYLSEIERGLKEASSEVLAAICDALGLELAELLAMAGSELAADQRAAGQDPGAVITLAPVADYPAADHAAPPQPSALFGATDLYCRIAA